MGIIILSETGHQVYENTPTQFISLTQCYGNPFKFINHYMDGMTLDISYKLLLQLKLEDEYNHQSFSPTMIKARDAILSWQKEIS